MNLKWDVNKNEKVVVWAADTPITLIGFSSNKSSVRKTTHFMTFVRSPSGVTHSWWSSYGKKSLNDKLKALKALLMPMITEMLSLREDDEAVGISRATATSLKSTLDETKTGVVKEKEEEEPSTS